MQIIAKIVLSFSVEVLLSTALPLDNVLSRDRRSNELSKMKATDVKSGVQVLKEYLVSSVLGYNNCYYFVFGRLQYWTVMIL